MSENIRTGRVARPSASSGFPVAMSLTLLLCGLRPALGQTPPANNLCSNCTPIETDVEVLGTTVGATGTDITSCGVSDTADVWHCWRASCNGTATVTACGLNFEATAAVFDACNGVQLSCRAVGVCSPQTRSLSFRVDQGATYLVRIAGVSGQTGNYGLQIECERGCGASEPSENEADCGLPVDTFNGGCNSDPPVFTALTCGSHICGTAGTGTAAVRDTDWYSVVVDAPKRFTWTVQSDFDATAGMLETRAPGSPDCSNITWIVNPVADILAGDSGSVAICLPEGEHWFFVAPALFETVECGRLYRADLICEPRLIGDVGCDGSVLDDWYYVWQYCLAGPQPPPGVCPAYTDIDRDGDVDLRDISYLGLEAGPANP